MGRETKSALSVNRKSKGTAQIVSPADLFSLSKILKTRTLYEITMLLLVSGVIVTIAIDFVFVKGMGWSLLTTTCIGYLISMVSCIYFLRGKALSDDRCHTCGNPSLPMAH